MRGRQAVHWVHVAVATLAATAATYAQSPVFTYQGQLADGGSPANGEYDFRFVLYDDAGAGNVVATEVEENLVVSDGLFTAELNYGANVLDGADLWLQIEVRPGDSGGAFTALTPRQALRPAPYAIQTRGMTVASNFDVNLVDRLYVDESISFVGINRNTRTTGAEFFGVHSPVNSGYGGMYLTTEGGDGWPFYGYSTPNGSMWHYYDGQSNNWHLYNAGTRMTVTNEGNIGIGTTAPAGRLHVSGGEGRFSNGVRVNGGVIVDGPYSSSSNAQTIYTQTSGAALDCWNDGSGRSGRFRSRAGNAVEGEILAGASGTAVYGTTNGTGRAGRFMMDNATNTLSAVFVTANHRGNAFAAQTSGTGRAGFFEITNAGNGSTALYCRTSGSGLALHADGTARMRVVEIVGADLAEKFAVSEATEPGTVMEIDPDNPGKLRIARGAYNRRVAGVVSGAGDLPAGAVLGHLPGYEDAPPIALSGRVWVHCDATTRAIEVGDLLTTSERPGHAMAVRDHTRAHGTILGKAMTALKHGETGLVLVLVTLQ